MTGNFWNALRAFQTGAASICLGGATIRLFPTADSFSLDEKQSRAFEKIRLVNEEIRQSLEYAYKSAMAEVERTDNETKNHS